MNHVRAANVIERYRGAIIEWQEPPRTGASWDATVSFESGRYAGRSEPSQGHSKENMRSNARRHVDGLLVDA